MKPTPLSHVPDTNGIFTSDAQINPDFHDWNKVEVTYCTSDGWIGDRGASAATNDLSYRGARVVQAVVEDLKDPQDSGRGDLDDATEIIVWGGSAGSHAVKHHIDRIAAAFPNAKVRGFNDSAYVTMIVPEATEKMEKGYRTSLELFQPQVDDTCKAKEKKEPWKCMDWQYVLDEYVETPTFIYMDQFDANAFKAQGITSRTNEHGKAFQAAILEHLEQHDGVFSTQAGIHVLGTKANFFDLRIPAGQDKKRVSLSEVFSNWYFERKGPKKVMMPPKG